LEKYPFKPYRDYIEYPLDEMKEKAEAFYAHMKRRRTIRQFSDRQVPREIIENCIRAAGTAPSGANMQPWHFVVVSNPETKKKIREAAEEVERDFYTRRAPDYWLKDLAPLGTDQNKPYLEIAPYLIVIFSERYAADEAGARQNHYYLAESVGIATGMLITALHTAGLATLTHTPHPMAFLRDLLGRPKSNVPYMLLVTGYPADNVQVPDIGKKSLDEIADFI
jgi:nitroreductase